MQTRLELEKRLEEVAQHWALHAWIHKLVVLENIGTSPLLSTTSRKRFEVVAQIAGRKLRQQFAPDQLPKGLLDS